MSSTDLDGQWLMVVNSTDSNGILPQSMDIVSAFNRQAATCTSQFQRERKTEKQSIIPSFHNTAQGMWPMK